MFPENSGSTRMRADDELIKRPAVQRLMGGISTTAVYDDPDLMLLKICLMPENKSARTRAVRWIAREVLDLRARRIARSEARAAQVHARVVKRHERRSKRARENELGT